MKALHSVFKTHLSGMQLGIVGGVGRLVAKQVAVSTSLAKATETLLASFAEREGDGAVRIEPFDFRNPVAEHLVGKPDIFSALKDEGAESQLVARMATVEDLFLGQPVALCLLIATDSAVKAVVAAVVRNLDEAAEKDVVPIDAVT